MADREKAISDDKNSKVQIEIQKQKEEIPAKLKKAKKAKKNKKKSKKRKNKSSNSDSTSDSDNSGSESDDHDASKSIRVAMRNKMKSLHGNDMMDNQIKPTWGHNIQRNDNNKPSSPEIMDHEKNDREMVNTLREKLKSKQELEMQAARKQAEHMEHIQEHNPYQQNHTVVETGWGAKESKNFWIKKDEEKLPQQNPQPTKPEEIPKPHMGFWTKQQVNMKSDKPEPKEDERDKYKDDRRDKYEKYNDKYREDKYRDDRYRDERYRDERYDRRRGRGDRERYGKHR